MGYDWSRQDTTTNPEERLIFMINGRPMSGKTIKDKYENKNY